MKKPQDLKPDTLSLHAGQRPDKEHGARATPIYQTSSFVFEDTESAAGIFNVERTGHVYSRITNPTNAVWKKGYLHLKELSAQLQHLVVKPLCT